MNSRLWELVGVLCLGLLSAFFATAFLTTSHYETRLEKAA